VPLFCGDRLIQWHGTLSQNIKNPKLPILPYGENLKSLSHLGLNRYRVMTDREKDEQTDRITVANARYSYASSCA